MIQIILVEPELDRLEPLLELVPTLRHPVTRQPLGAAMAELRGQAVKRVSIDAAG